ncbi:hypothetical protein EMIT047CA2_70119 [Pseudomonas soli]
MDAKGRLSGPFFLGQRLAPGLEQLLHDPGLSWSLSNSNRDDAPQWRNPQGWS